MKNEIKDVINKIFICGEKDIFVNGCRSKIEFIDTLKERFKDNCTKIELSDDSCSPNKEVRFEFNDFVSGEFKVAYYSILNISKICKVFFLQHEFSVKNVDSDRMDLSLDGFGCQPYTKTQFVFEENLVSFMNNQNYERLNYYQMEEVIPNIKFPSDLIFGSQMTVENAIFRDVFDICPEN